MKHGRSIIDLIHTPIKSYRLSEEYEASLVLQSIVRISLGNLDTLEAIRAACVPAPLVPERERELPQLGTDLRQRRPQRPA